MKDDHYKMAEAGLRRQTNRDNLGRKDRADVVKVNRFGPPDDGDKTGGDAEPTRCKTAGEGSSSAGIPEAEAAVDEVEMEENWWRDKVPEEEFYEKSQWEENGRLNRAQQRDRNERDHNDHMDRNTFADTMGLLKPKPFAPGFVPGYGKKSFRNSRMQGAHEARDERLKMAAYRQHDLEQAHDIMKGMV